MMQTADKTILITGANAGIGKDVARQLALRDYMSKIHLACGNEGRAPSGSRTRLSVLTWASMQPARIR